MCRWVQDLSLHPPCKDLIGVHDTEQASCTALALRFVRWQFLSSHRIQCRPAPASRAAGA